MNMWFSSNKHVVTVKVWINWCVCLNNAIKQYETLLSYEALRVADCVYPAHCWLKKKNIKTIAHAVKGNDNWSTDLFTVFMPLIW